MQTLYQNTGGRRGYHITVDFSPESPLCAYFICDAQINPNTNYWNEKLKHPVGISVFLSATPDPLICYLNRHKLNFALLSENLYESRFVEGIKVFNWDTLEKQIDTTARKIARERAREAFSEYIRKCVDGTYENQWITYTAPTDYSYVTPYYFKSHEDLFELIESSYCNLRKF